MTPAARERLGRHVRTRRRELGLGIKDAAARAGVSRMTWDGLENATRATRDRNYARIEHALQWVSGSIEAILDGGEPTTVTDLADRPSPGGPSDDFEAAILAIEAVDEVPEEFRELIISLMRSARRQQEQAS